MKEYGALRNAFQFQYHDSPVHRLGGGWKIIFALGFSAAAVAARGPWTIAGLVAALIGLYGIARLGLTGLWGDLRLFLLQVPIIVGLYTLRYGVAGGLGTGLKIAFQILLFFLPGALFLRTTRSSEIMAGLRKVMPVSMVFIISTSLRFVPFFVREIEEIALMQRLRGASVAPRDLINPLNWKDLFNCLFVPLLIRAIKTAEEAALSAEARGFGADYGTQKQKEKQMKVYISIDDTDNKESFGTGKMARMLAESLVEQGLIGNPSVTRHQFLIHPDIPYTSHNSCANIEADGEAKDMARIFDFSKDFLASHFHTDANPGLCVREGEGVPGELVAFGRRAQTEVIGIEEARELAARLRLLTWWCGKTGQGIIGAMGGIGLRSTGSDGRFIGAEGVRDIKGSVTVSEICKKTAITKVVTSNGDVLDDEEMVNTLDWVRPDLVDGAIVLTVLKEEGEWRTIEKAKRKKKAS